jgi:hypothetical protein
MNLTVVFYILRAAMLTTVFYILRAARRDGFIRAMSRMN